MFTRISNGYLLGVWLVGCMTLGGAPTLAADRPNILWITAEDMSPTLGCYGDDYAITPHLDAFAKAGVRYDNAFATAPVCSPSRSTLITGVYATSTGTHQMRSAFPLPDFMRGFPSALRELGYYTSNNVKTDYNTGSAAEVIQASWDANSAQASWEARDADQPFFSVFNLMTSHQSRSMVWPRKRFLDEVQSRLEPDEIHDPDDAPVPPYYPDTPMIRQTIARYYDCVTAMDQQVGGILERLESEGLADDTIVFFYSDHGSGLPRHKRTILDSGSRVALIVRFPEKYAHLAPAAAGGAVDRLVSFVDFGPTVLSLTGAPIPDWMQGRVFLGAAASSPRDYVHMHRDRIDEAIDLVRATRDQEYLYVRNYMPHLSYNAPSAWAEQGVVRREFSEYATPETWTQAIADFAGPTRPVEALYDVREDPNNLHNLIDSEAHRDVARRFRRAQREHFIETKDLGFVAESELWRSIGDQSPWEWARDSGVDLRGLERKAARVGRAREERFIAGLKDPDPSARYWAAIGLVEREALSESAVGALRSSLEDPSAAVRIQSANALARHESGGEEAIDVLIAALDSEELTTVLHAARTIELLGSRARAAVGAMRRIQDEVQALSLADVPATPELARDVDLAMFIGFSTQAFLSRVGSGGWTPLFNGEDTSGWEARADGEAWVEDGELRLMSEGANLWLVHEATLGDFELSVEAWMPDGPYNSGIGFRCQGDDGRPVGYQAEIDGANSGKLYAIGSGWVWPKTEGENQRFDAIAGAAFRDGEWNEFRVRCEGERIRIWLNGVELVDVEDDRFASGRVALQHHGRGEVHRFRNIRIRGL